MNEFIIITYSFIYKMSFTPLVLIGLLITSLTFILNLKDSNIYIRKFKKHDNLEKFINKIYYTSLYLILIFIVSLLAIYLEHLLIAILFLFILFIIISNFFVIIYSLKEIVRTSLKDDI